MLQMYNIYIYVDFPNVSYNAYRIMKLLTKHVSEYISVGVEQQKLCYYFCYESGCHPDSSLCTKLAHFFKRISHFIVLNSLHYYQANTPELLLQFPLNGFKCIDQGLILGINCFFFFLLHLYFIVSLWILLFKGQVFWKTTITCDFKRLITCFSFFGTLFMLQIQV